MRPPVWVLLLNIFSASTHDMIVRYHALWCNKETSSGYYGCCRLWFGRRAGRSWRVLAYTLHDCDNGRSTIFHVDSGQQVLLVLILDLRRGRIGHAVHEFDGCISE